MIVNFIVCELHYTLEDGMSVTTKEYSGLRCAKYYAVEDGPVYHMGIYARMWEDGFVVTCAESGTPEKEIAVKSLRKGIEILQDRRGSGRSYAQTALEVLTEKYLEVLSE